MWLLLIVLGSTITPVPFVDAQSCEDARVHVAVNLKAQLTTEPFCVAQSMGALKQTLHKPMQIPNYQSEAR